jgi:uncharacterized protein YkwD
VKFVRPGLLLAVLTAVLALCAVADPAAPVSREQAIAGSVIEQINGLRVQRGLPPFRESAILDRAASGQSRDMATYNFFDHHNPLPGRAQPWDRAAAAGYPSRTIAENLFYCQGTPDGEISGQCFQTWAESPGHRENMLDNSRSEIGVGVASSAQGETYITAVFGQP